MHKNTSCGEKFSREVFSLQKSKLGLVLAGLGAGAVNGLFGAGGGMVLVPLLTSFVKLEDDEVFPSSVSIILPICLVTLALSWPADGIDWGKTIPYLAGSTLGGIAAGILGKKISVKWLHRLLGILILWGGVRYLC